MLGNPNYGWDGKNGDSENWHCFHICFGEKTASVIFLDFYSIYLIFLSIYKILFDISNKTVDIL